MRTSAFSFVVPGDPRPKGRPRSGKGCVYTPRETVLAENTVKAHARQAKAKPIAGPVCLELRFYRATRRRCDWDNLAKLVCDALNGIAWRDDDQIVEALVVKGYDAENPRTEVTVRSQSWEGGGSWDAYEESERASPDTAGKEPDQPA